MFTNTMVYLLFGGIWNLIVWLIIGGLAGWVASLIMKTDKEQGMVGNIAVGVVGAFIGGFIVSLLGGQGKITGLNPISFLIALLGSVIFIAILRAIRGRG